MTSKKIIELSEKFESLTIKKQMKILSYKAANEKLKLGFKEIVEEFEKTLLLAMLERYNYNISKVGIKSNMHRNSIMNKMKKYGIKEKKRIIKK